MAKQEIRVLSVRQPLADLIVYGAKWSENRTWQSKYRGELYIHASSFDKGAMVHYDRLGFDIVNESPGKCRTGAIIGRVDLYDCVDVELLERIEEGEVPEGHEDLAAMLADTEDFTWEHVCGPVCWILTDPEPLAVPIESKGKLNVWKAEFERSALQFAPPKT